tara:strand:- start:58 stop:363 length:306 start_codon:yes stop_codon:yes gene_type:complete
MVVATFLIAFNISSVIKQNKTLIKNLEEVSFSSPSNNETWYLMAFHWISNAPAGVSQVSWTIPFTNEVDCKEAGKIFMNKNWLPKQTYNKKTTDYLCIKVK